MHIPYIAFFKTLYVIILITSLLSGCRNDRSKDKHLSTLSICNRKLYIETYSIFESGAYGGDRQSDYLTDSINFRIYIGTYDTGDEAYSFQCRTDSIDVYKVNGRRENQNKIVRKKTYSLLDLKNAREFD